MTLTTTEIILISLIWALLGIFICVKAKWYQSKKGISIGDAEALIMLTLVFSPLALWIIMIKKVFIDDWD